MNKNNASVKQNINELSPQELEKMVFDYKNQVLQLKREVQAIQIETEKLEKSHVLEMEELHKRNLETLENLATSDKKIAAERTKLEKKQNKFKEEYKEDQQLINQKIDDLKQKRKQLFEKQEKLTISTFNRRKNSIDNDIKELRETKKAQSESFNIKMDELKAKFDALLEKKKEELLLTEENVNKAFENQKKELDKSQERKTNLITEKEAKLASLEEEYKNLVREIALSEQKKIDELNKELENCNAEINSLKNLKKSIVSEYDATRVRNEKEYNETVLKYTREIDNLVRENELQSSNLKESESSLSNEIELHRSDYQRHVENLNTLIASLDQKAKDKTQEVFDCIHTIDLELNAKYEDYVASLEEELNALKANNEEEISSLEYDLKQEEEQLQNSNDFYRARYQNREEEFKLSLQNATEQLNSLNATLIQTEHDTKQKNELYKKEIAELENKYNSLIENKTLENEKKIIDLKKEYKDKNDLIKNDINQSKRTIEELNSQIEESKNDLNKLILEHQNKANVLLSDHQTAIEELKAKKAVLIERISSINEEIEKSKAKHEEDLLQIKKQAEQAKENFALQVNEIEAKYQEQSSSLNSDEVINALKKQHSFDIDHLNTRHNEMIDNLKKKLEEKKELYKESKESLDKEIIDIKNDIDTKIVDLDNQKQAIFNKIEELKNQSNKDKEDYELSMAQLTVDYDNRVASLEKAYQEELMNIVHDYETVPNEQLEFVRKQLEEKQREFDLTVNDCTNKKDQIDFEANSAIELYRSQRQKVDEELMIVNRDYNAAKESQLQTETRLNEELMNQRQVFQDYKEELDAKLSQINERKNIEYNQFVKRLEENYKILEKRYEEKRASLENKYNQEVETYRKHLDSKHQNLDSLIKEISLRKEKVENQAKEKYKDAIQSTNEIQEKLDLLLKDNELKNKELQALLDNKKLDSENAIKDLQGKYYESLKEKKKVYQDYLEGVMKKVDEIKADISQLELDRKNKEAELRIHEEQKSTYLKELSNDTKTYLDMVHTSIIELIDKQNILEKQHQDRVQETKKQIASSMSEYDDLLRQTNILMNEAGDNSKELEETTAMFKEKIASLELSQSKIMQSLADTRNNAIIAIQKEIEAFESNQKEKMEEYQKDITSINEAYDALIRDEHNKREILNRQMEAVNKQVEIDKANMYQKQAKIKSDYESSKQALVTKFKNEMLTESEEFKQSSADLKQEFEDLVNQRNGLNKELKSLVNRYRKVDEEILKGKTNLQVLTRQKFNEILDLVEDDRKKRLERISKLDTMSKYS